jgi:hypothetical protein
VEIGRGLSSAVLRVRQPDAEGERGRRIETRVDGAQFLKAADHEAGCDQQDERERDLRSHQELSRAVAPPSRRLAATVFVQRRCHRRQAEDRDHAEHCRRDDGESDREADGDDVETNFLEARQAGGPERHQQPNPHPCQRESQHPADDG